MPRIRLQPVETGFHGTGYSFDDEVLPPNVTGSVHGQHVDKDMTYFHVNEDAAWDQASRLNKGGGRPRVHLTRPEGPQYADSVALKFGSLKTRSRMAKKQQILSTHWVPPVPQGAIGVQGTLPGIDWREFGQENWTVLHPDQFS